MREIVTDLVKLSDRCFEMNVKDNNKEFRSAGETLVEYLQKHDDCLAIAANQFSYKVRMFAIKFPDGIKFFVNPMISHREGLHACIATDPSIPGKQFLVARNDKITIDFQDVVGMAGEVEFDGTAAELIQQECDIVDGVTIADYGLEVFDDFFDATADEQSEVIDAYMKSLQGKSEELAKEIEADPILKQTSEAIDFMTKVAKGEVTVETPKISRRKQKVIDRLNKKMKNLGKNFTKKKKKKRK